MGHEVHTRAHGHARHHPHRLTGHTPFLFSVALPEGNYNVTVTLGDADGESSTTVKAESRRLMLEEVCTARGRLQTRTFTINVRTPALPNGGRVRLKDREQGYRHWDDKLTLEFNGARPCLAALEIAPAPDAITVQPGPRRHQTGRQLRSSVKHQVPNLENPGRDRAA